MDKVAGNIHHSDRPVGPAFILALTSIAMMIGLAPGLFSHHFGGRGHLLGNLLFASIRLLALMLLIAICYMLLRNVSSKFQWAWAFLFVPIIELSRYCAQWVMPTAPPETTSTLLALVIVCAVNLGLAYFNLSMKIAMMPTASSKKPQLLR
jgi:hypothetical protein